MDYTAITLIYQQQQADLELPLSVSLFTLAPLTLEALAWERQGSHDNLFHFVARIQGSGVIIRPTETLAQAGVVDGDIIELTAVQNEPLDLENKPITASPAYHGGKPYLQSVATSEQFPCRGKVTLVGRSPECAVNLTPLPGNDVVSRRHANIVRRDDGYWLNDENSTNGTIVDGYALDPNEKVRLRDGCQIQFGENGPVFVFYTGGTS